VNRRNRKAKAIEALSSTFLESKIHKTSMKSNMKISKLKMKLKKLLFLISLSPSFAFRQSFGKVTQKSKSRGTCKFPITLSTTRVLSKTSLLGMLDRRSEDCTIKGYNKKEVPKRAISIASTALIPATILFGILSVHPWGMEGNPIEAEVLNDLSHVALDLLTLINPDTLILRAASVVGRILSMTSDYVLDNRISPDDLILQSGTLTASIILFAKSALPLLTMVMTEERSSITFRDKSAYQSIFRAAGVSWMQYLMLLGTGTIEWIDYVSPKTVLHVSPPLDQKDEKYVYWLYQGNAEIKYYGNVDTLQFLDMRRGKSTGSHKDVGLLADTNFIANLHDDNGNKCKRSTDMPQVSTVTVGSKGATVLKINMDKLTKLTKYDNKLKSSLRNLFLNAMHKKLRNLLAMKLEHVHGYHMEHS